MTPRYPGAQFFGHEGQGGRCTYRSCSWHEAVTTARSVAGWNESAGACHGFTAEDGTAEQYVDFHISVAGVLNGNGQVLTWENWDGLLVSTNRSPDGSFGPNDIGWTPQQFERNADIMAWMVDGLGIPLHLMQNTEEPGHGPHRLGVPQASGAVQLNYGPTKWTNYPGKQCCGDQRILQLPGMLARAQAILNGVRAGEWGWLPQGPVDVTNLRGGGSSAVPSVAKEKEWDEMATEAQIDAKLDALFLRVDKMVQARTDATANRIKAEILADLFKTSPAPGRAGFGQSFQLMADRHETIWTDASAARAAAVSTLAAVRELSNDLDLITATPPVAVEPPKA